MHTCTLMFQSPYKKARMQLHEGCAQHHHHYYTGQTLPLDGRTLGRTCLMRSMSNASQEACQRRGAVRPVGSSGILRRCQCLEGDGPTTKGTNANK